MRFWKKFKIIRWLAVVALLTVVLSYRITAFVAGGATAVDFGLVVIWALLFLAPIYVEVSVGGVTLKQQIENVRDEIKSDVASVRSELRAIIGISNQVAPQF